MAANNPVKGDKGEGKDRKDGELYGPLWKGSPYWTRIRALENIDLLAYFGANRILALIGGRTIHVTFLLYRLRHVLPTVTIQDPQAEHTGIDYLCEPFSLSTDHTELNLRAHWSNLCKHLAQLEQEYGRLLVKLLTDLRKFATHFQHLQHAGDNNGMDEPNQTFAFVLIIEELLSAGWEGAIARDTLQAIQVGVECTKEEIDQMLGVMEGTREYLQSGIIMGVRVNEAEGVDVSNLCELLEMERVGMDEEIIHQGIVKIRQQMQPFKELREAAECVERSLKAAWEFCERHVWFKDGDAAWLVIGFKH